MKGQLFTQFFLADGIRTTPEWDAAAPKLADFRRDVRNVHERFVALQQPNEAVTEHALIRPVMELLGWSEYLPQQAAAGHEDVPDHLLFADAATKVRANRSGQFGRALQDALIVQESKRFGLVLDQRDRTNGHRAGIPHGQMLRYLTTTDVASEGRIRFGILTNGSVWRLYDRRARPRASGFFEADLADLLEPGNEDGVRAFLLLFGRDSFTLQGTATTTFLEAALAEGRRYEESVAQDLGYDGPPLKWDPEQRSHLRARLDALYFHLYGLSPEDAAYVLDTFPIVRRQDEVAYGTYRTRDLILAYMNGLAAGDTATVVKV